MPTVASNTVEIEILPRFENEVKLPRGIFRAMTQEDTGGGRKLRNEKLRNLYS